MIKEILYNGVTTTPDDYLSKDGDLAYCSDLIHEDGSIKPAPVPVQIMTLPTGYELMYIHKEHNYENWIFWTGSQLAYIKKAENGSTYININITEKPKQITSIENDLCVILSSGIRHLIYKDQAYNLLPSSIPQLDHTFALVGLYQNLPYQDNVYISGNSDQKLYTKKVASVYLNGNYDPDAPYGSFVYTKMDNCVQGGLPAGYYKISVALSVGKYFRKVIIRTFDGTNPNPIETITVGDMDPKPLGTYEYSFKISTSVDHVGIFVYADESYTPISCMATLYASQSNQEFFVTKNDDHNGFEQINAAVKRFIQTQSLDRNRHIFPFFVRTALRLHDGSYVNLSAPALLIPNSKSITVQPLLEQVNKDADTNQQTCSLITSAVCCDLQLKLENISQYSAWKDYIKDIVIAITPPIYDFDLNLTDENELKENYVIKKITSFDNIDTGYSVSALTLTDSTELTPTTGDKGKYLIRNERDIYQSVVSNSRSQYYLQLPKVKNYKEELEKSSTFYIIKSLSVDELLKNNEYASLKTINLGDITFNNLTNYKSLPEDYSSLSTFVPNKAVAYNNRLHIADYLQNIFEGYDPLKFSGYIRDQYHTMSYLAFVKLVENQNSYTVRNYYKSYTQWNCENSLPYFFYPHTGAKSVRLYKHDTLYFYYADIDLRQHPYMNGCYWFDDFKDPDWTKITDQEERERVNLLFIDYDKQDVSISKPNYMKISELGNALTYTDERTYTFDSKIQALSAIVTALSTGQAGQFDLYVLTETDGVWTLKINDQGSYSHQIPVTRDTIINPKSLTQLDSAILFATARGLMMLQGSKSTCISEALNSVQTVNINNTTFKGITSLVPEASTSGIQITYDFKQYLQQCQISYDYTNQRIIVHNPYYSYCYALSLRSQNWTILNHKIKYTVNSYPDAYVVDDSNHLLNLSQNDPEGEIPTGIILTRPFSLDQPNEFKLLDKIRQNGYIDNDNIQQILYGSNDLKSWYLCASSKRGYISDKNGSGASSFRFFRLALSVDLAEGESLDSFTAAYRIKESNDNLF